MYARLSALFAVWLCMIADLPAAPPTAEQLAAIEQALPAGPLVEPARPRRLLVFTLCKGFRHSSIECGAKALELMGRKTGAYQAVISDDPAVFAADSLAGFDAVCFLNTTGTLFTSQQYKQNLMGFVRAGGGVVGIHAATDCFYDWPAFGRMMGGWFDGHPWTANTTVTIRLDHRDHPLTAHMPAAGFEITDEIYQFKAPYSRRDLLVLLSLDNNRTDMQRPGIHRSDGDFAVSWVRRWGKGRVFYCSLGHREDIYFNPLVLRHYLAGIQYALGDLDVPDTPPARATDNWQPLFNGRDLAGWRGLAAEPPRLAEMTPEQRAAAQARADEQMRRHWSVRDGVLVFDGQGQSLCSVEDYDNFELTVDWQIGPGGDSGIYLRGTPQVQIWDADKHPEGSGGLYNNQRHPRLPIVRADNPTGQWNNFRIRMAGELVSVWLNDLLVVDDVPLENYWQRAAPLPATGPIELQSHHTPLRFRDIRLRRLSAHEVARIASAPRWRRLLSGTDLTGWLCKPGSWEVLDGVLTCRGGGGYVWSAEQFDDFVLDLEFRIPPKGNSGVFFRTADPRDPVQTGIELQILDSFGQPPGRHQCGAIYDCLAPRVQAVRPAGEWNHLVLRCEGPQVRAWLNGVDIIDMNLDDWKTPRRNPDGSPNKFRTAYTDMPRRGHIGFQDHGAPVSFRNIFIKPLKARASEQSHE